MSARTARDTLFRQWALLRAIPREPLRRSTRELTELLDKKDVLTVTIRTVQRDLSSLSKLFPITCDQDGRTQYWYFPKSAQLIELPEMSSAVALALTLARDQSRGLIPPATLALLEPYFGKAEELLGTLSHDRLSEWRQRVRVVHRGPPLRPLRIDPELQQRVYDALLERRILEVEYRARDADAWQSLRLHPQGLVLKEGVLYLGALAWDYDDLRQYALHRIRSATVLAEPVREISGAAFDAFVARSFQYPRSARRLRLKLRVERGIARLLEERPLSEDQTIGSRNGRDGSVEITASVDDTEELRWWLLSLGTGVEVLAPAQLRRSIGATVRKLARRYSV